MKLLQFLRHIVITNKLKNKKEMRLLISKPESKMPLYKLKNIQQLMIQKHLQLEMNGKEDTTNKKIAFRFKCKNTKN